MTEHPSAADRRDLEMENARLRRMLEQQGMPAELRHQVRNTLGMIRSIVRRSAEFSGSAGEYAAHLEGRIEAIMRVQGAITREAAEGIDLHGVVADEFLAHAAHEGEQVHIAGPPIRLRPKVAGLFALAIHELTTNAVKFGALRRTGGRIAVDWNIASVAGKGGGPLLNLQWVESVAIPGPPATGYRGFGTEVLEGTLRYELKAETRLEFVPEGLRCTVRLPFTPEVGTHAPTPAPGPPPIAKP